MSLKILFWFLGMFMMNINLYSHISSSKDYELITSVIPNSSVFLQSGNYLVEGVVGEAVASDLAMVSDDYILKTGFYNPAHFQFQKGMGVSFNWNNELSINFPAESVELERFDILWQEDISNPDIDEASRKLSRLKGIEIFPVKTIHFAFVDDYEMKSKFLKKGRVSVKVEDSDGDGYVDNQSSKIRFKTLSGYIYNSKYKSWDRLGGSINYDGLYAADVSFDVLSGGIFGIMGDLDTSVKDTYAYPVPFRPNGPKSGICPGCTGTEEDGITFANLPQQGYIEIYTVDGRLVKKIILDGSTTINWDTKNDEGKKVVSGVYIWRVVSESYQLGYKNSKTGKLVIIR